MGCGSCGTGKPNGCKSNGGCSSGGCNRMNVHDWLANLPFADVESACKVVEISFNNGSRKDFFRNTTLQHFEKGENVTVEGVSGFDVGEISMTGELVRLQMKKRGVNEFDPDMKKILRRASDRDIEVRDINKAREPEAVIRSRAIAKQLKLNMKISQVEMQADGRKATFFYIADDRVDFRELIKVYAGEFKVKVEMRQIGARQEAAKVGGVGSCGRELCCSTWLTDFKSVNTTAARYQNLSINQTKLSGQCGRLKCCLNYELDTYLDALQHFPENADTLQVGRGNAILIKKDIFKNLMWYVLPDSTKQYPVAIDRVKKIRSLNMQGIVPDELEVVEVTSSKVKEVEPEFVDVVGQISLQSLDKNDRKKKQSSQHHNKSRNERQPQQPQGQGGNNPQQRSSVGKPQQPQGKPQQPQQPNRPPQQPRPPQQGQGQRPAPQQQQGGNQQQRPPQGQGQQPQKENPQQRPPQHNRQHHQKRPNRPPQQPPQEGGEKK
ncbi:PSP1 domain-containing protein [Pinibacter soli]|uniref:Regulatory iron-sulfur-containing complex subunit RicT n=1 Tax=Pinibacter soli TaxID=3044211 RepID=A0ABT6RE10_9BACT|nr:regulatory iron-sulfur-containing complex subunit RicT [Pinibacter soli]MDI3320072.1 regulatory iron-sulfur-containing complex subunit RicT [Pinibacter soli]